MSQYAQTAAPTAPVIADLRSDTVTTPCQGMRAAMAAAEVGDDVYGEDPSILRLEAQMAGRLGKDAALFVPSGTQSNLLAMLAHCARGEEVIAGDAYHVIRYEASGASVLGGIALHALQVSDDGGLDPAHGAGEGDLADRRVGIADAVVDDGDDRRVRRQTKGQRCGLNGRSGQTCPGRHRDDHPPKCRKLLHESPPRCDVESFSPLRDPVTLNPLC